MSMFLCPRMKCNLALCLLRAAMRMLIVKTELIMSMSTMLLLSGWNQAQHNMLSKTNLGIPQESCLSVVRIALAWCLLESSHKDLREAAKIRAHSSFSSIRYLDKEAHRLWRDERQLFQFCLAFLLDRCWESCLSRQCPRTKREGSPTLIDDISWRQTPWKRSAEDTWYLLNSSNKSFFTIVWAFTLEKII